LPYRPLPLIPYIFALNQVGVLTITKSGTTSIRTTFLDVTFRRINIRKSLQLKERIDYCSLFLMSNHPVVATKNSSSI